MTSASVYLAAPLCKGNGKQFFNWTDCSEFLAQPRLWYSMAVSKQFAFPWLPSVFSFPLSPAADPGKCRCKQIIALKHLHILVLLHLPALAGLPSRGSPPRFI